MLIPYNVDRPTRRQPYFTYGLIGINTLVFLITVVIANVYLPADHVMAEKEIAKLVPRDQGAGGDPTNGDSDSDPANKFAKRMRQQEALVAAYKQADNAAGYQQFWQVQHAYDTLVLEPHYSVLNVFAYRASEKSFGGKILGMLGSMFLHGGFEHLIGNMVFLWVFGRALEDTLGPAIYIGAYLLCGIAATLLYHIITMQFSPQSAGIPLMGASGAIAGVLGLFAMRFYRTPVRIFYILPTTLPVVVILMAILTFGFYMLIHEIFTSLILGVVVALVGIAIYGRNWAWGNFKTPSAWAIGVWLILFNLVPGINTLFTVEKHGGTAYWAHVGGFLLGMIYAALIGSQEEGKVEYMLEDAQKALSNGNTENAVSFSENLLQREPNNAGAYEVIAKSYDRTNNEDAALDNYELAISRYIQSGEREKAAQLYLDALRKHTHFILAPEQQLIVGNQMAKNSDFQNAAETLVKIPYTFPDAPEGEVSLLRSAQLYLEHLKDPQMASQLLAMFVQRYPDTHWMPQAERALKIANFQLSQPEEGAGELGLTGPLAAPPAPTTTRPRP